MLELFGKIISIVQHSLESQETSITQIDPINWQLALLTQNPFPDTPPSRPEDTVWAGFPDLKKQLDTLFTEAFSSSQTQIILTRGVRGSGKTSGSVAKSSGNVIR
jgi:hypothetical protein